MRVSLKYFFFISFLIPKIPESISESIGNWEGQFYYLPYFLPPQALLPKLLVLCFLPLALENSPSLTGKKFCPLSPFQ